MSGDTVMESACSRAEEAREVRKYYMLWSMGAGLLPIPLLDLAAVIGVQIQMIRKLAEKYEVAFDENRTKAIVTSLVGGVAAGTLAMGIGGSLAKIIPGIGHLLGAVSFAVFAGAVTYAVGGVFILHFETGGSLLDFDVNKMRQHFHDEFLKGQEIAREAKSK